MTLSLKFLIRQVGMILVETAIYLLLVFIIYTAIVGVFVLTGISELELSGTNNIIDPISALINDYIPLLVGSVLAVFIVHRIIFKRSKQFDGIVKSRGLKEFLIGIWISVLLISVGFLLLYLFGLIRINQVLFNPTLFFVFFIFFLIQSSAEEVLLRSFLLPMISFRLNIITGIIISSLTFTLLHVGNPNVTSLSVFNIFLAGVMLGMLFIKYGKIWAPIGLHVGWNFLQGTFFGFEVSGLEVYSFIDSTETGNDLITGGAFGYEGSILASIVMLVLCSYLWRQAPHRFKGQYLSSQSI